LPHVLRKEEQSRSRKTQNLSKVICSTWIAKHFILIFEIKNIWSTIIIFYILSK
jgi:hypothetical protein